MNHELLEHILDVSRRLVETRTLTPLLEQIIVEALDLVGAERGYIVLVALAEDQRAITALRKF